MSSQMSSEDIIVMRCIGCHELFTGKHSTTYEKHKVHCASCPLFLALTSASGTGFSVPPFLQSYNLPETNTFRQSNALFADGLNVFDEPAHSAGDDTALSPLEEAYELSIPEQDAAGAGGEDDLMEDAESENKSGASTTLPLRPISEVSSVTDVLFFSRASETGSRSQMRICLTSSNS